MTAKDGRRKFLIRRFYKFRFLKTWLSVFICNKRRGKEKREILKDADLRHVLYNNLKVLEKITARLHYEMSPMELNKKNQKKGNIVEQYNV